MPPKKKVERAATENISLGPQVREGEYWNGYPPNASPKPRRPTLPRTYDPFTWDNANILSLQVNLFLELRMSCILLHSSLIWPIVSGMAAF